MQIDTIVIDTDWKTENGGWTGEIACEHCRALYSLIDFWRGVAAVRKDELERQERLLADAKARESAFLHSGEVAGVLDAIAGSLERLPTAAAKYRVMCELGLETATLATFRNHIRGVPMRRWLDWQFPTDRATANLEHLGPLYRHIGIDPANLEACLAASRALREEAAGAEPTIVERYGPVGLLAALSKSRRQL